MTDIHFRLLCHIFSFIMYAQSVTYIKTVTMCTYCVFGDCAPFHDFVISPIAVAANQITMPDDRRGGRRYMMV